MSKFSHEQKYTWKKLRSVKFIYGGKKVQNNTLKKKYVQTLNLNIFFYAPKY